MARIRTIKPEFPQSQSMGHVSRDARLCFVLLWTLADDEGRLRGNSRMLASLLFPYDDDAPSLISGWLDELHKQGCIALYEVDGHRYVEIRNWLDHQKIDRPSKSKFPAFANARESVTSPRDHSSLDQGPRTKDQGPKDQRTEECSEAAPRPSLPPSVASQQSQRPSPNHKPSTSAASITDHVFPTFGCAGGKRGGATTWLLTPEFVQELQQTYPAIDVAAECRKAHLWVKTRWAKRKTAKGMPDFLRRWMEIEQDSGGRSSAPSKQLAAIPDL